MRTRVALYGGGSGACGWTAVVHHLIQRRECLSTHHPGYSLTELAQQVRVPRLKRSATTCGTDSLALA
jgi:hypothetical protein